jgi:hypothetical protein
MRMQRGVKLGMYSDAKERKQWPYFRDEVGLNRTESETTKVWDTECGKVRCFALSAEQSCRRQTRARTSCSCATLTHSRVGSSQVGKLPIASEDVYRTSIEAAKRYVCGRGSFSNRRSARHCR